LSLPRLVHRGALTALAVCVGLASASAVEARAPKLRIYPKQFNPGDQIFVDGQLWLWMVGLGCDSKINLSLRDSKGHEHSLGRVGGKTGLSLVLYEGHGDFAGIVHVPEGGVAPGPATVHGVQRLRVKFPGLGCSQLQIARKSTTVRNLTVLGAEGNSPPVVTGLAAPPMRQSVPAAIAWNASEAGHSTIDLEYVFTPKRLIKVGRIFDADTPAGANRFAWTPSFGGQALPTGRYRIAIRTRDAQDSQSAPKLTTFPLGFGP
jgi:hypothetical protein